MSGKQIFGAVLLLIIVIRSPQLITQILNGIMAALNVHPAGG